MITYKMSYLNRILASQTAAELVINNQLAYARSVINDQYLPWDTKQFMLEVEGLSWAIKVILEEAVV